MVVVRWGLGLLIALVGGHYVTKGLLGCGHGRVGDAQGRTADNPRGCFERREPPPIEREVQEIAAGFAQLLSKVPQWARLPKPRRDAPKASAHPAAPPLTRQGARAVAVVWLKQMVKDRDDPEQVRPEWSRRQPAS
jgi:hypothetical protein